MAKSLRNIPLPPIPGGPIKGDDLRAILRTWQLEVLAELDVRNDATDFAPGLVATETGVTLGSAALPSGRTVGVPTLFTYIGDGGRAASQRFLHPVTAANLNSVQSASTVLSAVSGASTATINVAAHTVAFDFGSVSYSAGSVSGVALSTTYRVYASDSTYAGGAVTYLATTNPQNVIGQGYYYVGSVTTGVAAASGNVSAATSANPIVVTVTAHGWSNGNTVIFSSMPGDFAALNGNQYVITYLTADTFSIAVNGTAYGAYTTGGSANKVYIPPPSYGGGGGGGIYDIP